MKILRFLLLFLLFTNYVNADEEITLKIYPKISTSPTTLKISWKIAPHPDNREFTITGYFGGDESETITGTVEVFVHGKSLDGENERSAFDPIFIPLEDPGNYTVIASLKRLEHGKLKEYRTMGKFQIE